MTLKTVFGMTAKSMMNGDEHKKTGICLIQYARFSMRIDSSLVNVELFRVKGRIRLDEDGLADHLLHLL